MTACVAYAGGCPFKRPLPQPGHGLATLARGLVMGGTLAGGLVTHTRVLTMGSHPCKQPACRWPLLAHRQRYLRCHSLQQTCRIVLCDSISSYAV
ncbi:hypothetical protein BHM03_00049730 [Ensete ventricosum]|nr:hypothetical protein BHM03_00049730 [Ensete ventricosum]